MAFKVVIWPSHASLPDDLLPPGLGKSKPSLQGPGFLLLLQQPGPGEDNRALRLRQKAGDPGRRRGSLAGLPGLTANAW